MKKKLMKFLVLILSFIILTPNVSASTHSNLPVYGTQFDVDMYVQKNGVVKVRTNATVFFNQKRQGIFVNLPVKYSDYNFSALTGNEKDNNRTYYFPITNFKSSSHKYEEEDSSTSGVVYRMGKEGVYLNGSNTFEYEYTMQLRDLKLSDNSHIFLMNLIGERWDFPFEKLSYRVEFEKNIGDSEVLLENSNFESITDFKKVGNVITGVYDRSSGMGHALTMLVKLPDGYFNYKSFDYSASAAIGAIVALGFIILLKSRNSKSYPVVQTVEFTAPEGLSSADVAYIDKNTISANDVTSLIIFWAEKGFLTIEEFEDKTIELTKVKDLVGPKIELDLFNALFLNRDKVKLDELKEKFYNSINKALLDYNHKFKNDPEYMLVDKKSQGINVGIIALLTLVAWSIVFVSIYNFLAMFGIALAISVGVSFAFVAIFIFISYYGFDLQTKNSGKGLFYFITIGILFILGVILALVVGIAEVNKTFAYIAIGILLVSTLALTDVIRRTQKGSRWLGQVLGLKRFIKTTEVKRLEMFAEETPHLFYNILPFAYVLGLSDVWSKKFETIAVAEPDWYRTTYSRPFSPYLLTRSLNRSMSRVSNTMTSTPPAKSSSGGGFSGGSSGGGFGGGGFGGGGGGSW
ncbi:MAG: DUF2207 domain-containing protein [Erysipelothrix sp.]|nr:DUF2207 domain-containing protein [Erysipelothrix sp.]